jgi:hypothetical protein
MLIEVFIGAIGKAAVGQTVQILRDIAGLQEAQLSLLRSINHKVDRLLSGPFETGRLHLEDAMASHRSDSDKTLLLQNARASFKEALGQDDDPLRRSLAHLSLAIVWINLGSEPDVRPCLQSAHREALHAQLAVDKEQFRGWRMLRIFFPEAVEERFIAKDILANNALLPYTNGLAVAARAWGASDRDTPILELSESSFTFYDGNLNQIALTLIATKKLSDRMGVPFTELDEFVRRYPEKRDEVMEAIGKAQRNELLRISDLENWLNAEN